ncbi:MAG: tetratricopeptide repeat protein, partial [Gallionella sp.]
VMYYIGQAVTQSHKEAAKWFTYAGRQGNALAQNIMGEMHDRGLGVPQNYTTAAKWYRLSAEQGNAQGQYNLGIMHERELGVRQDYVLAYMWLLLAKAPTETLSSAAKQMTNEQISRAKKLANQCSINKFKGC